MSVIQSIREKYAKWAVVAIALALLGFILTDYFQAKERMGRGNSSTIGIVNGKKIDYSLFESKLKGLNERSQREARNQGRQVSEAELQRNNEELWNNEVEQIVMVPEFKKVGIDVGKREFNDWLFGPNAPNEMKSAFGDQQGNYDGAATQAQINQLKKTGEQAQKDQLDDFLAALEYGKKVQKFNFLLTSSVYYPKWFIEKQNAEAASLAKVSFVRYPYSNIPDSSIKVSDKEIEDYVNKYKSQFKQEEARNITYVVFDGAATAADSAAGRKQLEDLKAEFAAEQDPAKFISRYGGTMEYYDGYVGKSLIQVPAKDSIFALAKNAVYGPYLDQHSYVLAKLIDSKPLPDSVKARHILIQTFDPQNQQQILDDSTAKKRIDSIETAIKGGAKFDSLVRYSADQGSAIKGGVLSNPQNPATNYYTYGQMVKEFNDFSFEGKVGDKKVVKTIFGYHYIEILDQKNFQPHYKIAYFAKNIVASPETLQAAEEEASKFSSESNDLKSFDANITKSNGKYTKMSASNIKPNDVFVQGLNVYGPSRQLVREVYKAKKGDVLKHEKIGDIQTGYKYVVVAVTDILEEGTQPAYIARIGTPGSPMTGVPGTPGVERTLKDKKKAEQIKQMIGKLTTLEAAAAVLKDSILVADSVRISGGRLINDAKTLGAIFNPSNKGKLVPEPIAGRDAVYVIRVDDLTTTSVPIMDLEMQRAQMKSRTAGMQMQPPNRPVDLIKKESKIRDNRRNFY
jgi:peptidyl-prolyl cis-trans isomerase D